MLEAILDYEEVKEAIEEVESEISYSNNYNTYLALIKEGKTLATFETYEDLENIETEAVAIAKKIKKADGIDLYYLVTSSTLELEKILICKDIVVDEAENYQKINNHITILDDKEVRKELKSLSEDIFIDILQDNYKEVKSDIVLYDNCIEDIYNQLLKDYENNSIIQTSENSFVVYDNYMNVCSIKPWDFENFKYSCLTESTKNFLIDNIYDKWSLLNEEEKKEVENKIENY